MNFPLQPRHASFVLYVCNMLFIVIVDGTHKGMNFPKWWYSVSSFEFNISNIYLLSCWNITMKLTYDEGLCINKFFFLFLTALTFRLCTGELLSSGAMLMINCVWNYYTLHFRNSNGSQLYYSGILACMYTNNNISKSIFPI